MEDLRRRLDQAGQGHLLKFYHELQEDQQKNLLQQLEEIDFEGVTELFQKAMTSMEADVQKLDSRMEPIPPTQFSSEETSSPEKIQAYYLSGLQEISKGHVGIVLMAGGQGTRLGVSYPKGMYSVGLPSNKSLFQIQAERIRRIETLAERETGQTGHITWYIMTSKATVGPTKQFLIDNNYFGLDKQNIVVFEQGVLPCFDFNGQIFLEDRHKVALAPDGNGGIYRALDKSGVLTDMEKRGILYIHAHSVDNILIKVADPVFIGYCVSKGADCAAKVVRKASPTEAVGVVCLVDKQFQVVEYSEITDKTAHLANETGDLIFNAGNICNHYFSTEFLRLIANKFESELKLHIAKKKIPHVDENGQKISPNTPNGIKIEKFVFDVFQFSNNFVTWEVPRHKEFSALKNADAAGKDCPKTAREALFNLHKRYLEEAGGVVSGNEVEISPLLSYDGEDLEHIVKGREFVAPVYLKSDFDSTNGNA